MATTQIVPSLSLVRNAVLAGAVSALSNGCVHEEAPPQAEDLAQVQAVYALVCMELSTQLHEIGHSSTTTYGDKKAEQRKAYLSAMKRYYNTAPELSDTNSAALAIRTGRVALSDFATKAELLAAAHMQANLNPPQDFPYENHAYILISLGLILGIAGAVRMEKSTYAVVGFFTAPWLIFAATGLSDYSPQNIMNLTHAYPTLPQDHCVQAFATATAELKEDH